MNKLMTMAAVGLLSIGISLNTQAQVKVGGAPGTLDQSALLQVGDNGASKGLLLPRVALTATNVFGLANDTKTAGMVVYNTATGSVAGFEVNPGAYYWNGTLWVRLIDVSPNTTSEGGITQVKSDYDNLKANTSGSVVTLDFVAGNIKTSENSVGGSEVPLTISDGIGRIVGLSDVTLTVHNTAGIWNAGKLQGYEIKFPLAPNDGQVLTYDNGEWKGMVPGLLKISPVVTENFDMNIPGNDYDVVLVNAPNNMTITLPTNPPIGKAIYFSGHTSTRSAAFSPALNASYNTASNVQPGASFRIVYTALGWVNLTGY
ncbi:MAG: hypothetical protein LBE82_02100 [Chitinophagaceae bacterium]|nr:hypothetical protein [Chitinophagaceae bacterium]